LLLEVDVAIDLEKHAPSLSLHVPTTDQSSPLRERVLAY
jgi:hypothetical protein